MYLNESQIIMTYYEFKLLPYTTTYNRSFVSISLIFDGVKPATVNKPKGFHNRYLLQKLFFFKNYVAQIIMWVNQG